MYCSIFLVSHVPCCSACFIIFRGIALFRIVTSGVCKRHADTRTSKRRVTAPSRPTTVFVFMVLSVIFEHLTFGQNTKNGFRKMRFTIFIVMICIFHLLGRAAVWGARYECSSGEAVSILFSSSGFALYFSPLG